MSEYAVKSVISTNATHKQYLMLKFYAVRIHDLSLFDLVLFVSICAHRGKAGLPPAYVQKNDTRKN